MKKNLIYISILTLLILISGCSSSNEYSLNTPNEEISALEFLNREGKYIWFNIKAPSDKLYLDSQISEVILEENGQVTLYLSKGPLTFEDLKDFNTTEELFKAIQNNEIPNGTEFTEEGTDGNFSVSISDTNSVSISVSFEDKEWPIITSSNENSFIFKSEDNFSGMELSGFVGGFNKLQDSILVTPTEFNFTDVVVEFDE